MQPLCRVIVLEHNNHSYRSYKTLARSLKRQGWSWSVFAAVDGHRTDLTSQWQQAGVTIMEDRGKLRLRPGAQGCWLSHFQLWSQCRESGRSMIILEDDVIAASPWDSDIAASQSLVKLYANINGAGATKTNSVTGQWSQGSLAYWLTAAHADQLICHAQQHGAQALDKHLGSAVLAWQHWPRPLFVMNPHTGPSTTSPLRPA